MKYVQVTIKNLVLSLLLSICICGFYFKIQFFLILFHILLFKEAGDFLGWLLYHCRQQKNKLLLQGVSLVLVLNFWFCNLWSSMVFISLIIGVSAVLYSAIFLKLDYFKYEMDISYLEKILAAQNSKNTILLNQYAKEKIAVSLPTEKTDSKILKNYPFLWKAFGSIKRTNKVPLYVGGCLLLVSFLIYTVPFFAQFPFLEIAAVRYFLFLFGIFLFYQILVQTFQKQLEDLYAKDREGLFLPIEFKHVLRQFILAGLFVMMTYLFLTLYLSVKNRTLLNKLYTVFSLAMLAVTNLLL